MVSLCLRAVRIFLSFSLRPLNCTCAYRVPRLHRWYAQQRRNVCEPPEPHPPHPPTPHSPPPPLPRVPPDLRGLAHEQRGVCARRRLPRVLPRAAAGVPPGTREDENGWLSHCYVFSLKHQANNFHLVETPGKTYFQ